MRGFVKRVLLTVGGFPQKTPATPRQKKYYTAPSLPSGPLTFPTANEENISALTQKNVFSGMKTQDYVSILRLTRLPLVSITKTKTEIKSTFKPLFQSNRLKYRSLSPRSFLRSLLIASDECWDFITVCP